MARSTIKNTRAENFDLEKLQRFTQEEFAKLNHCTQNLPFCYQVGTTILVGPYKIVKQHSESWTILEQHVTIADFFNRKHAIFYCISLYKCQYQLAKDILRGDTLLKTLEFEASLYRARYKKSQASKNQWQVQLFSTKYLETMQRIAQNKKEIKKNLQMAKYFA